jgi:hypothetical protein
VQLSDPDPEVPRTSIEEFQISPDGQWVVFSGEDGFYLSTAPVDGSSPAVQISYFHAGPFTITPDSSRIVWMPNEGGLLAAPIDGSGSPTVLDNGATGIYLNGVSQIGVTPDGTRVVVAAQGCTLPTFQCFYGLFSVPLDGSSSLVELSIRPSRVASSRSPDSSLVVFPRRAPRHRRLPVPVDGWRRPRS